MISPGERLSVARQARLLNISRSSLYYRPRPVSAKELKLMRMIDELHLEYPFAGSRLLRDLLLQRGVQVGRRHIRTLMWRMGIEALYRKPNTSKPAPGHRIYPYLLRADWPSRAPIRCGRWTSATSRWRAASSIWRRSLTGSVARF